MKNFDFKAFFLEKGEKIGLWTAVGITLLMVVLGLFMPGKGLFAQGAAEKARALEKQTRTYADALANATPTETELGDLRRIDDRLQRQSDFRAIDADPFRLKGEFFAGKMFDDTKRRPPKVLAPDEFITQVVRAQVRSYILSSDRKRIMVLHSKDFRTAGASGIRGFQSGVRANRGAPVGGFPGMLPGGPGAGMPGGGMAGMQPGAAPPAAVPMGAAGGEGGGGAFATEKPQVTSSFVDLDKLSASQADVKLAETIRPLRIAMVAASFPYKKQLEEYQKQLRLPSIDAVLNDQTSMPVFQSLVIERQEIGPDGKGKGWVPVDVGKTFTPLVVLAGRRVEPDDPKLLPLLPWGDGLVMPRLLQFREGQYPKAELELKNIDKALTELEKQANPNVNVKPPNRFTSDEGINPFSSSAGNAFQAGGEGGMEGRPMSGVPGGEGGTRVPTRPGFPAPGNPVTGVPMSGVPGGEGTGFNGPQWLPPEHVLLRFFDVTVEPGKTYEYHLKLKLANPNQGRPDVAWPALAQAKELISADWIPVPERIYIPTDLHYYVVDQRSLDQKTLSQREMFETWKNPRLPGQNQVAIQAHRWVPYLIDVSSGRPGDPVGDWVVGERYFVARGESLAQPVSVEAPVWDYLNEVFTLAGRVGRPRGGQQATPTVPVFFGDERTDAHPLLVDFHGGDLTYTKEPPADDEKAKPAPPIRDKAPLELLIMNPNGKLIVRDSETDAADKDRIERHKTWRARVKELRDGGKGTGTGPVNPFGVGGAAGSKGS